jgi:hypothetical protein
MHPRLLSILSVIAVVASLSLADAVTLKVDVFCFSSGPPPGLPFLAGHAEVSAAGDLTAHLLQTWPQHP